MLATYIILDSESNIIAACSSASVAFSEVVDCLHPELDIKGRSKVLLSLETSSGQLSVNQADFAGLAKAGSKIRRFPVGRLSEASDLVNARAAVTRLERAAAALEMDADLLPTVVAAREALAAILVEQGEDDSAMTIVVVPVTKRAYNKG